MIVYLEEEVMTEYYEIGTQVNFIPVVPEYNDKGVRYIKSYDHQEQGVVVGLKDVPLGIYRKGGTYSGWDGLEPDYEPPCLDITGSVRLYRIRTNMLGREMLAIPESVKEVKTKFILPLGGRIRQWVIGGKNG